MQAAMAATGSRLIRVDSGMLPFKADPHRTAFNLEWRPRAGNISGDTRAGDPAVEGSAPAVSNKPGPAPCRAGLLLSGADARY